MANAPSNKAIYQSVLQAPLIMDELISDSSSDVFTESASKSAFTSNYTSRTGGKRQGAYQRSDGEVGGLHSDDTSAGELRFPSNMRNLRLGAQNKTGGHERNKDLGLTYNYDEDKLINEGDVEKPVYDSSEGPVHKGGKAIQARPKATDVFVSGESFGPNLIAQKQAAAKVIPKRETIGENFLEEEDGNSSGLAESGEIDPRLFR